MKIYDIISESRLTEAPGAPIIGEFINAALKTMAWTLGRGPRTKAAEELAKVWAKEMIENTAAPGKIKSFKPDQIKKIITDAKLDPSLALDDAVKKEGYNAAKKIYQDAERKGFLKDVWQGSAAKIQSAGKVTNFVASTGKWITRVLAVWECADAWSTFSTEQNLLKAELESGKITEAQYISDTRSDWTVFLAKVGAAVLVTRWSGQAGAIKKDVKELFLGRLEQTGPWTSTLKNLIETAKPAATLLFFKYLNSKEGNKLFTNWLTSAGGKWKGIDGIIEWATAPSQFLDVAGEILNNDSDGSSNAPPAQSGQRPAPSVGTTPGGASVSGDWK